jgi:hypothetical protein
MSVSHSTTTPRACSQGSMAAGSRGESTFLIGARARLTGIFGAYLRAHLALVCCLGSLVLTGCAGDDSNPDRAVTYSVSGTVGGAIVAGVTISLSGTATASTTTNASGNYSFTGLANGSYTVTPSNSAYVFSPSSLAVSISGANVTGQDFIAYSSATSALELFWDGCTAEACGPAMGAPNHLCTDGTVGGPGPCKRDVDGHCGWSYRSCQPVTPCTGCMLLGPSATACEPPQAGASGPSGQCVIGPGGACSELLLQCFTP